MKKIFEKDGVGKIFDIDWPRQIFQDNRVGKLKIFENDWLRQIFEKDGVGKIFGKDWVRKIFEKEGWERYLRMVG